MVGLGSCRGKLSVLDTVLHLLPSGLSCAALLAKYGYKVTVCEAHDAAGGAAHCFHRQGYTFESGPSFFFDCSGPKGPCIDPLRNVLAAVGESVEWVHYREYLLYTPEGVFKFSCNPDTQADSILRMGGPEALAQWRQLEALLEPIEDAGVLLPAAVARDDLGAVLTSAKYVPRMLMHLPALKRLTAPLSELTDGVVTNPWLCNFLALQCYGLSGMGAEDTIAGSAAFMLPTHHLSAPHFDYPVGGSGAIADALVRGIEKHGGRVMLHAPVDSVVMDGGRAAGVRLVPRMQGEQAEVIRASKGVISNASVWDTMRLLPPGAAPPEFTEHAMATPPLGSFLHMHLGIDASGLPEDLGGHHIFLNDWDNLQGPQNMIVACISSVFDPGMAPPGKACVHVYTLCSEPYELWEGLQWGSPEYKALKEERSQPLWQALERAIPDVRQRAELVMVASPLTHQRFLHRYRGAYGPVAIGGAGNLPGSTTPVPGLYRCGDSCMPGLGVPCVAFSGMRCANTLAPVGSHLGLLAELGL